MSKMRANDVPDSVFKAIYKTINAEASDPRRNPDEPIILPGYKVYEQLKEVDEDFAQSKKIVYIRRMVTFGACEIGCQKWSKTRGNSFSNFLVPVEVCKKAKSMHS